MRFNMLGVHWQGTGRVDYRTRSLAGRWSAWQTADADTGPDRAFGRAAAARLARRQPRLDGRRPGRAVPPLRQRLEAARLLPLVEAEGVAAGAHAAARRLPTIVTRTQWEADEKITRAKPLYATTLKLAVVHHTAASNTYTPAEAAAIVRGIEVYHVKGNGWNDIGYNFLVDRFGTVYEGRAGGIDAQRDRGALAGVQHRHGRRGSARQLRPCDPAGRGAVGAREPAGVAARHRARRSALAGRRHLRRQRELPRRQGRDVARDLRSPRHRPDRVPRQPHLSPKAGC